MLFETLKQRLILIPEQEITHKNEAEQIMKDIDVKDSIFIALALSTPNDDIWSEDKHFKRQEKVRVWKTEELMERLGLRN